MAKYKKSQIEGGILLIGLGILFLLNSFGIISGFNWEVLFRFWPVLIILVGFSMIFSDTPLWWLTTVIFVAGIIILVIINPELPYNDDYPLIQDGETARYNMPMRDSIRELDIELNIGAGRFIVDSVNDEEHLYELFTDRRGRMPEIDYFARGKTGHLKIKAFNFPRGRRNWQLNLNPQILNTIELNTGAGKFELDFSNLKIKDLQINSGAADLGLYLGNNVESVEINMGAGNIKINVPEGKEVRIKSGLLISTNNFEEMGLIKTKSYYQSPGYDRSPEKLLIEINAPLSNIQLHYYSVD